MNEARRLAVELLAGPWSRFPLQLRAAHQLGRLGPDASVGLLISHLLRQWPRPPKLDVLIDWLAGQPGPVSPLHTGQLGESGSEPMPPRLHRPVVALGTRADLLRLLDITDPELDWFADLQVRGRRVGLGPLQHYRYRWLAHTGTVRLLEIPKPRLKEIQRRLLRHAVRSVPLHPAAHGAVLGRSVRSCVQPHAGRRVLVRCDLEGFFAAIGAPRVRGIFAGLGLNDELAAALAGLCTSAVPLAVRRQLPLSSDPTAGAARWRTIRRLAAAHLPQGSPTSPGLANIVAYSMDHRLQLLATSLGARYTRYVDDLIFSSDDDLPVGGLLAGIRQVAADEGFRLAERKTAVLRRSRRQAVLGTVINDRVTFDRRAADRLRAVLHNCDRDGVASQLRGSDPIKFRLSLQGQLSWVSSIDAARGARLRAAFERIDWTS